MRASQVLSVRTRRDLYDRVWGQPNRLCQWHCDRDRKQRIAAFVQAEDFPPEQALAPRDDSVAA